MKESGIYMWTVHRNGETNRFYIGQAVDLKIRQRDHMWALKNGRHKNKPLQNAFDVHGQSAFKFCVLEHCNEDALTTKEQEYVDSHIAKFGRRSLYNILTKSVVSRIGLKNSTEQNAKIGLASRSRTRSESELEHLRQMSFRMRGCKLSLERIAQRTAKQKGRVQPPKEREMRRRLALARPPMSVETRAKISATKKARGQQPSAEAIAKRAAMMRGQPMHPNAYAAIQHNLRTRIRRPETYTRMVTSRRRNAALRGESW